MTWIIALFAAVDLICIGYAASRYMARDGDDRAITEPWDSCE